MRYLICLGLLLSTASAQPVLKEEMTNEEVKAVFDLCTAAREEWVKDHADARPLQWPPEYENECPEASRRWSLIDKDHAQVRHEQRMKELSSRKLAPKQMQELRKEGPE